MLIVLQNGHGATFSRADDQVFPSVPIDISPGHSGTQLTELFRKQRLQFKVVKAVFVVDVYSIARCHPRTRARAGSGKLPGSSMEVRRKFH